MEATARLITTRAPRNPDGVVLLLHGGAARRDRHAVSPTQLSVLRMVPIAHRLARAGRGRLAVVRLLNSVRGWDSTHNPVADAQWALDQLQEQYDGLPASLVGHSLGGRAALLAGDHPSVRSVVALNPWVHPKDRVHLGGRSVLVVHGTEDRIADPARAERLVESLSRTTDVTHLEIPGGKHAMLRHRSAFEDATADFVTSTLLGAPAR